MLYYLVYLASKSQSELAKQSLKQLNFKKISATTYRSNHHVLDDIVIQISLLSDINDVADHLKDYPVDLLILDERNGGFEACSSVYKIESDVRALTEVWGADFYFPKGRMMVLIEDNQYSAEKSFQLGRLNIRDVLAAPSNLSPVIRWIAYKIKEDSSNNKSKVGIAFNGGALEGYLFESGCALALSRVLKRKNMQDFDVFSGVSSGSILAASLAAGLKINDIIDSIYGCSKKIPNIKTSIIYDFSVKEILGRVVRQLSEWKTFNPAKFFEKVMSLIPNGVFKGLAIETHVRKSLESLDTANDFRSLTKELYIGVTHQDSFKHVIMGTDPWAHIPISDAIRASCSVPPFFAPHKIEDEWYIDGQISSPSDLEYMVRKGCNLIFIVDPIIPHVNEEVGKTENSGGVYNLIQSLKTLISGRFCSEVLHITERFPEVDFIVFRPKGECSKQMKGSPFKFRINTDITELSYKQTIRQFIERYEVYKNKLAKYDLTMVGLEDIKSLENKPIT